MALDPRISLGVQSPDVSGALRNFMGALDFAQRREQQNVLAPLQLQQVQQQAELGAIELQNARDAQRLANTAIAAQELKPLLQTAIETGDDTQVKTFLTRRIANLQKRAAAGEMIDATESIEALDMVNQGQIQGLLDASNNLISIAGQAGLGGVKETKTASQKDFETFKQLEKTDPVAAKQFGQQAGFVSREGRELSGFAQEQLNESANLAEQARVNASQFIDLANELDQIESTGGVIDSVGEFLKNATGQRNKLSELKTRYNKIKGGMVVKNLPPGAASDTDIALALRGFPPDNAKPQELASFLRGVAKMESEQERFNVFKNDYISENGSLRGMLKEWRDIESKNISFDVSQVSNTTAQTPQVEKLTPSTQPTVLKFDAQGNLINDN